eukprot:8660548-Pyramimonas_sp.AAC.1
MSVVTAEALTGPAEDRTACAAHSVVPCRFTFHTYPSLRGFPLGSSTLAKLHPPPSRVALSAPPSDGTPTPKATVPTKRPTAVASSLESRATPRVSIRPSRPSGRGTPRANAAHSTVPLVDTCRTEKGGVKRGFIGQV